jgi:hypothetical protein
LRKHHLVDPIIGARSHRDEPIDLSELIIEIAARNGGLNEGSILAPYGLRLVLEKPDDERAAD